MTTAYARTSPVRTPPTCKLMSNVIFTTYTNLHYPFSHIRHQERIKVLSWRRPHQNELTAVKIGNRLTNITWPFRGLTWKPLVLAVHVSWSSMSHLPTIIETTLAAKSKSIYSCQNEVSADRYQVTVLRDHFSTIRRKQGTADWKSAEKCVINISHQNR